MSYVSLENSEPFLKCFEVLAEDKSCIVSDSVLYFSGKTGKGFITVAGIASGIEVLAVNLSQLTEDLTFHFQPSAGASSYLLCFDEIDVPGKGDSDLPLSQPAETSRPVHSTVSITDVIKGRTVTYPKDRIIRSLIVRVKRESLEQLIHDFDAGTISTILQSTGNEATLTLAHYI